MEALLVVVAIVIVGAYPAGYGMAALIDRLRRP